MPFEFFPNTNFHDLNLDYILEKAQKIDDNLRDSQASADAAKASEEAAAASEAAAQLSEEAAAASEAAAKDYADHIADPVSGLVTDWLEDNITQETGYVLDASLTSAAAAAPAKTVGDNALLFRGSISDTSTNPNDFTKIGSYYITSSVAQAWYTNHGFPFPNACRLTVIGGTGSSATVCMQIAATETNVIFYRTHQIASGGAWNDWVSPPLLDNTMYYRDSISDASTNPDNFTQVGMYYVVSSVAQAWYTNHSFPFPNACRLTVIGGTGSSAGVCMQVAHRPDMIYVRIHDVPNAGAWGEWKSIPWANDVLISITPAMFPTIAICGGSYDSGWTSNRDNTSYNEVSRNYWIAQAANRYGFDYIMLARHGMSIPDFFNYTGSDGRGYPGLISSAAADLYITTFAANDDEPLGELADMTSGYASGSTPSTFYGYYAKLIYEIRQKAPNAAIILTTPESEGIIDSFTSKITAIYNIASNYNLPVINWHDDPAMAQHLPKFCRTIQGGMAAHPTSAGYSLIAEAFPRVFSKCALHDPNFFNYYV